MGSIHPPRATAAELLKALRLERLQGISQPELSRRIHAVTGIAIGYTALSKLENGKCRRPHGRTAYAIEQFTRRVTPDCPIVQEAWYF